MKQRKNETLEEYKLRLNAYRRKRWGENYALRLKVREQNQKVIERMKLDPEFREKKKQVVRAWKLRKNYGLTLEDYDKMVLEQEGKCAICLQIPPPGSHQRHSLHVDHCHNTGKVRGLLCRLCNMMIGSAQDNIITLSRAVEYLSPK